MAQRMRLAKSEIPAVVERLRAMLDDEQPASSELSRQRLRARLTVLPPGGIPAPAWPLLEWLWEAEARSRATTRAADLPRLAARGWGARVSLWRGDITALEIDAIVNAANPGLTGCYHPLHTCVDNAIHTAAGPWLREECGRIMARRNRPEPTATATVTRGYYLPARHVLHTVGPVVGPDGPSGADRDALRRCYLECLRTAAELPEVSSLAFCGIATGLYGYPAVRAAPVALEAVRDFLERDPRLEPIVLVVYSREDQDAYVAALREALPADREQEVEP